MKNIKAIATGILLGILVAGGLAAADSADELAGVSINAVAAQQIVDVIRTFSVSADNNTWFKARNAANSANINILKVDATDDTVINADTGDVLKLSIGGTAELTLDDDKLSFSGAAAKIVPGATSLSFRNNADDATNFSITNAGAATIRAGLTVTSSDVTATAGEFIASTSGKTLALQEATAGDKCMGSLTCNGASDVVTSTTCATTGSRIFLTRTSLDADTTGDFYVKSISTGVSFTVACETSDTGTLNWIIFHESA